MKGLLAAGVVLALLAGGGARGQTPIVCADKACDFTYVARSNEGAYPGYVCSNGIVTFPGVNSLPVGTSTPETSDPHGYVSTSSTKKEQHSMYDFLAILGAIALVGAALGCIVLLGESVERAHTKADKLKRRLDDMAAAAASEDAVTRVMSRLNLSEEDARATIDAVRG